MSCLYVKFILVTLDFLTCWPLCWLASSLKCSFLSRSFTSAALFSRIESSVANGRGFRFFFVNPWVGLLKENCDTNTQQPVYIYVYFVTCMIWYVMVKPIIYLHRSKQQNTGFDFFFGYYLNGASHFHAVEIKNTHLKENKRCNATISI